MAEAGIRQNCRHIGRAFVGTAHKNDRSVFERLDVRQAVGKLTDSCRTEKRGSVKRCFSFYIN